MINADHGSAANLNPNVTLSLTKGIQRLVAAHCSGLRQAQPDILYSGRRK
jgi:hypothetical protein